MKNNEFVVQNMYMGRRSGEKMFNAQRMAIEYMEKHLGKDIRIVQCDHEVITKLQNRLEEAEKALDKMNKMVVGREYGLDAEEIWEITKEYFDKYSKESER